MPRLNAFAACLPVLLAAFLCSSEEPAKEDAIRVFRFSGGENVTVQVFYDQRVDLNQIITSDGFVSLPGASTLNIRGMTLAEASAAMTQKIKEVRGLKAPQVSLAITALPARRIYIQGAVRFPQALHLPQDHDYPLAALLAEAGGTTEDADLRRIKLVRRSAKGNQTFMIDATHFGKPSTDDLGPILCSGDVVIVPTSEAFSITGEVQKPGFYSRKEVRLAPGLPVRLSHLVTGAEGTKPSADRKNMRILRTNPAGDRKVLQFDLEAALTQGSLEQDPVLEDGDQVIVPASEGISITGRVRAPGIYYPSPGGPMTVARLVALAGGFDQYAKKSQVIVVFKDKPGQAVRVDMKAVMENGQLDLDLAIRPGDMVFVGESSL